MLIYTAGDSNSELTLLRPERWWELDGKEQSVQKDESTSQEHFDVEALHPHKINAGDARFSHVRRRRERLALDCGPVRQIALAMPTHNHDPQVFARCEYTATLVDLRSDVHDTSSFPRDDAVLRLEGAHEFVRATLLDDENEEKAPSTWLTATEKLVFGRRLTCAACSPFTRTHAVFLDEDCRLFQWHADQGAVSHGPQPLRFPAPTSDKKSPAVARRERNEDVDVEYGHHPRILWIAAQHRAYRVDLREPPSRAALAPALNPAQYFKFWKREGIVKRGSGNFGNQGDIPKIRALAVGRYSAHEVFVGAGLHLVCMDDRFTKEVVARWVTIIWRYAGQ